MSILKLSMACWLVADETCTRRKIVAAKHHGVAVVTGGGPFEIAVAQGQLPAYFALCADLGVNRVECGEGFTELDMPPQDVVAMAHAQGLEVQFELGKKHDGQFTPSVVDSLLARGREWVEAGAVELVIEARESGRAIGIFDGEGNLDMSTAELFVEAFGADTVVFEAPTRDTQFALLDALGPEVRLSNVRLEELLRVEIYRRGLHSDSFGRSHLTPRKVEQSWR
jgi:phosphosulfolactate synthase